MVDKKLTKIIDTLDKQFEMWNDGTKTKDDKLGPSPLERPVEKASTNTSDEKTDRMWAKKWAEATPEAATRRLLKNTRQHPRRGEQHVCVNCRREFTSSDRFAKYCSYGCMLKHKSVVMRRSKHYTKSIGILVVVMAFGFIAYAYSTTLIDQTGPVQEPSFSIKVIDFEGVELDDDWFSYSLYGTPDIGDFQQYVLCETGGDLGNLRYADVEYPGDYGLPDGAKFVCRYNGTSDTGVVYQSRWAQIQPGHPNVLFAVATPLATAFTVSYLNFTSVNPSAGARGGEPVLITAFTGPEGAAWYAGFDYELNQVECPSILVVFSSGVSITTFNIVDQQSGYGLFRYRVNATCLRFDLNYLGPNPMSFVGTWDENTTTITNMALMYGDEQIRTW